VSEEYGAGASPLCDGEEAGMTKNLLLAVGNGMMGDDGAGALLAQMMRQSPVEGWEALNGGSTPENVLHQVRDMAPDRVLVVDASDMDAPPGTTRLISLDRLDDPFLFSTHTLPLTYLIEALKEFTPQVELLGIQPQVVAFGAPMSDIVRSAVVIVYEQLKKGNEVWENM
jgi:hydrogenase 3 maturation protease